MNEETNIMYNAGENRMIPHTVIHHPACKKELLKSSSKFSLQNIDRRYVERSANIQQLDIGDKSLAALDPLDRVLIDIQSD